jgi:hypothetical protein
MRFACVAAENIHVDHAGGAKPRGRNWIWCCSDSKGTTFWQSTDWIGSGRSILHLITPSAASA